MKVVSFNVNSIRQRFHQIQEVIKKYDPDFIGLQETKVSDEDFPLKEIESWGYHAEFHGQKTHYGVALLSKEPPLNAGRGFPNDGEEAQRRLVYGEYDSPFGTLTVINGYFPQGENRDHPVKFPNKEKFYADLHQLLKTKLSNRQSVIVMGDMNVAPLDEDIGIGEDNRKRWLRTGKTCFLPEEREWLSNLQEWGLEDTYRRVHPEVDDRFSWFDYRSRGFERDPKRGLRIDLILATLPLAERCVDAGIDYDIRAMSKPSDHCPVWSYFK